MAEGRLQSRACLCLVRSPGYLLAVLHTVSQPFSTSVCFNLRGPGHHGQCWADAKWVPSSGRMWLEGCSALSRLLGLRLLQAQQQLRLLRAVSGPWLRGGPQVGFIPATSSGDRHRSMGDGPGTTGPGCTCPSEACAAFFTPTKLHVGSTGALGRG